MAAPIKTTLYTDPGCPWAYSAIPALRVLEWRYGAQLDWRLVMIGLTESSDQYKARGYTTVRSARGWVGFRRFGMPFAPNPKNRVSATARACRAIVAAGQLHDGAEWQALRALQLAQFSTPLVLEDDEHVSRVVGAAIGVPAALVTTRLLQSMLFGVGPWDGRAFAGAALALFAALAVATFVPAWRATRVTPATALRE